MWKITEENMLDNYQRVYAAIDLDAVRHNSGGGHECQKQGNRSGNFWAASLELVLTQTLGGGV